MTTMGRGSSGGARGVECGSRKMCSCHQQAKWWQTPRTHSEELCFGFSGGCCPKRVTLTEMAEMTNFVFQIADEDPRFFAARGNSQKNEPAAAAKQLTASRHGRNVAATWARWKDPPILLSCLEIAKSADFFRSATSRTCADISPIQRRKSATPVKQLVATTRRYCDVAAPCPWGCNPPISTYFAKASIDFCETVYSLDSVPSGLSEDCDLYFVAFWRPWEKKGKEVGKRERQQRGSRFSCVFEKAFVLLGTAFSKRSIVSLLSCCHSW